MGKETGKQRNGETGEKHPFAPSTTLRAGFCLLPFVFFLLLLGCQRSQETPLIGQPEGPYRLELALSPSQPQAGQETTLTYRLTDNKTHQPVTDLQVLHERILHTFIVSRDFQTLLDTHHEDFFPLTSQDIAAAQFHFPYTFPRGQGNI